MQQSAGATAAPLLVPARQDDGFWDKPATVSHSSADVRLKQDDAAPVPAPALRSGRPLSATDLALMLLYPADCSRSLEAVADHKCLVLPAAVATWLAKHVRRIQLCSSSVAFCKVSELPGTHVKYLLIGTIPYCNIVVPKVLRRLRWKTQTSSRGSLPRFALHCLPRH